MNGPTRSNKSQARDAADNGGGIPAADIFDELDQFVDSEPAGWVSRQPAARRAFSGTREENSARFRRQERGTVPSPSREREPDASQAAFSSRPLNRREAFAKRLSEELKRPDGSAPTEDLAASPAPASSSPAPASLSSAPASSSSALAPPVLTPEASGAPAPSERISRALPVVAEPREPVIAPPVSQEGPPADALEWELDNAIGAIVANNTRGTEEGSTAPVVEPLQTTETDDGSLAGEETFPDGAAASASETQEQPVEPDQAPERQNPAKALFERPIGTLKRLKPIPSFRFERRSDGEENEPSAAPDMDNPLSSVFFKDVREQFESVHPNAVTDGEEHLADDQGADELDDEFRFADGDDDRLPPSLARAGERRRVPLWRSAGVASVMAAVAVIAIAAVVGVNVFAGSGETDGAPPTIRADAADVKERAPVSDQAEPDITERAQIGENQALVMPEEVDVDRTLTTTPVRTLDEGLISRRVQTIAVRPDGTFGPEESLSARAQP
ncbi:MAG: hypothetical protein AAGB11_10540, partial [Pseudomonadota bacterium]